MNARALAQAGYEAYLRQLSHQGAVDVPWDELQPEQQNGWIAAVAEICELYGKAVLA
jgi:hypothetical protein